MLAKGGLPRRAVTPQEMKAIEPTLAGTYYGGYFTESDSTGDIHKFTSGLAAAAERLGVRTLYGQDVTSVQTNGRQAVITVAQQVAAPSVHTFDGVVVCAGVASRDFAAQLGDRVNIYPVKGYSTTVNLDDEASQRGAPQVSLLDDETKLDLIRTLAPTEATLIFTPIVLKPDYRALASPVGILHAIKTSGAFALGTKGADTIPELAAFGERIQYVSGKVGFNGFSGTHLDEVLREKGIKRVLLAGMVTSLCIDSTGRAAYERGYSVTVLSDCTSSRTATEQDCFCSTVFPLYGEVLRGDQVMAAADTTAPATA